MSIEKENFLRTKLVPCLQRIDPSTAPRWGKMSLQHMIEHFAGDAVRNASGRLPFEKIMTPPERLPSMREFLMSEKPFKENTNNPLMGEEPAPLRYHTRLAALAHRVPSTPLPHAQIESDIPHCHCWHRCGFDARSFGMRS